MVSTLPSAEGVIQTYSFASTGNTTSSNVGGEANGLLVTVPGHSTKMWGASCWRKVVKKRVVDVRLGEDYKTREMTRFRADLTCE